MNGTWEGNQTLTGAQSPPYASPGRGILFIWVVAVCLGLLIVAVVLRVYCRVLLRRPRTLRALGCDDFLAIMGLLAYLVVCSFTILAISSGLGTQEERLSLADQVTAAKYAEWGGISYLIAVSMTKTSIGFTVLRIAHTKISRWPIIGMMILCNIAYLACLLLSLVFCTVLWKPMALDACTRVPHLPCIVMAVSFLTSAAFAIIPAILIRRMKMPAKSKRALIGVCAIGGLASLVGAARFPLTTYWDQLSRGHGSLYMSVWIPVLGTIEIAIALVAASLPSIGATLHFFNPTRPKSSFCRINREVNVEAHPNFVPSERLVLVKEQGYVWANVTAARKTLWDDPELDSRGITITEDVFLSFSTRKWENVDGERII